MTEELKPCPFCGQKTSVRVERSEETLIGFPGYVTICAGGTGGPGGCGAGSSWADTPAKAAAAWNTRAESAEIERLRAENKRLREGIITLRDTWHTSHYMHFDRQGTAGRNCPACIADGIARQLIEDLAQLPEGL